MNWIICHLKKGQKSLKMPKSQIFGQIPPIKMFFLQKKVPLSSYTTKTIGKKITYLISIFLLFSTLPCMQCNVSIDMGPADVYLSGLL